MGRPNHKKVYIYINMSLISNLRPLAKGKGCSLAKGSHGPSSSSCWAWHEPPGPPTWHWHDFSCPAGEAAARSGGGPVGVGCAAMFLVHRPQLVLGRIPLPKGQPGPGFATTGSGPGLARPAGSTPAARHPCKRVKEVGRASRALEKAREVAPPPPPPPPPPAAAAAAATPAAPKQPAAGPPRAQGRRLRLMPSRSRRPCRRWLRRLARRCRFCCSHPEAAAGSYRERDGRTVYKFILFF